MPKRVGEYIPMETLPKEQRIREDREFQVVWYKLAGGVATKSSVLDVGAGMGYGDRVLRTAGASHVESFDRVSLVPWVKLAELDDYLDESFDYVVAMDVIEHVTDDVRFLGHLLRIARKGVFFSTPNWLVFQAQNKHHFREYTPEELVALIGQFKAQWRQVRFWTGDEHHQITDCGSQLPLDTRACNFGVLLER